jgi:hypothetical protein
MNPLREFAARAVTTARLFEASLYGAGALVLVLIMLWLTASSGANWFVLLIDAVLAFYARRYFVKACEIYAASRQPERPDERQRYLESRQLYSPRRKDRAQQRRDD